VELPGIAFGLILVVILLGLAGYSAWRQQKTLHLLRTQALSDDDRRFFQGQVRRRLASAVLMVVFAGLLIGSFFLAEQVRDLKPADAAVAEGARPKATQEQKGAIQFFTIYWIIALLVLLGILALAAIDLWAIARFGLRQHRQLEADRRAILADEVARLRQEGNGQG
jgi:hypothetical protein